MSNLIEYQHENKIYKAHSTAIIDDGAEIENGTIIWHFSHVMKGSKIGSNCIIGQNCFIGSKAVIGSGVKIQNNVSVYDNVILEDDVFCGPSMVFTNVINPRAFIERKSEYQTTFVKKGATIGANTTIICGVTIGMYAMIGAGAVITKNVPDFAVMTGVPAKQTGWICMCGEKLDKNYLCKSCGVKYSYCNNLLTMLF